MSDQKHIQVEDGKNIIQEIPNEIIEQPKPEKQTPTPEGAVEFIPEKPKVKTEEESFLEESISSLKSKLRSSKKKPTQIPQVRDELTIQVEKIMEQDLSDAFAELTTIQKQEFKMKGERTAFAIRALLKNTHVKVKAIFKLIFEWLKLLPGINKFFLEQEAKIKTDKILALRKTSGK